MGKKGRSKQLQVIGNSFTKGKSRLKNLGKSIDYRYLLEVFDTVPHNIYSLNWRVVGLADIPLNERGIGCVVAL